MKVVQINTVCGWGSTGTIAVELAEELQKYDVQTVIAYGQKETTYKNTFRIGSFAENKIHSALARITGKQGYYTSLGTKRLLSFLDSYQPDVIHLHNLHGNYLNYPMLFDYLAKHDLPVLFTLHDCWAYTGKCAHYIDLACEKWKTQCMSCPHVKDYPPSLFFDCSASMYKAKKHMYQKIKKMTVVGVSDWIADQAELSILKDKNIVRIYNWIDFESIKFRQDSTVLEKYGIKPEMFTILGVTGRWSPMKGIHEWNLLIDSLSHDTQIIMVGHDNPDYPITRRENVVCVPYIESTYELSVLYSVANVYVNLSKAESFGKTTAEALCCGTPVIVFDTTACPELIGDGCGFVAPLDDVNQVMQYISTVKSKKELAYYHACTSFAQANFAKKNNTSLYYDEYKKLYQDNN